MPSIDKNRQKQCKSQFAEDAILTAALQLMKCRNRLRMQDIADISGYSIGAVYHHFESRTDLLANVWKLYLGSVLEDMEAEHDLEGIGYNNALKYLFKRVSEDLEGCDCLKSVMKSETENLGETWKSFSDNLCDLLVDKCRNDLSFIPNTLKRCLISAKIDSIKHSIYSYLFRPEWSLSLSNKEMSAVLMSISGIHDPDTAMEHFYRPN